MYDSGVPAVVRSWNLTMSSGELLRGFLKGKDIYFPYYEVSWIMDINLGFSKDTIPYCFAKSFNLCQISVGARTHRLVAYPVRTTPPSSST